MAGAIQKLTDELQIKYVGNKYIEAVKNETFEMLCDLCNQSETFEKVIAESNKTLNQCFEEITKNIGSTISDIELYRRAVQFYCPDANVYFDMRIEMPNEKTVPSTAEPQNIINIFDVLS